MSFRRRILAFVHFAFASSMYARRLKGDVVFATSTPLTIAVPGIVATAFRKTPLVFEVRDLWPEAPIAMGALSNPVSIFFARGLEKVAYKRSKRVVALSPGMADGVVRAGYSRANVVTIPNAADLDLFEGHEQEADAWRGAQSWLGKRPMVLYCGTLGLVNRVEYLVDVAVEMKKLDPEVRFVVVGSGSETEHVESRARGAGVLGTNFYMLPSVPKSRVPVVFRACDISISLVAPIKELEANSANKFFDTLAAGKPIALNYGGWQADLIDETGAGIRLDAINHQTAAAQLLRVLGDRKTAGEMGHAARRLAESKFSRNDLAEQLRGVLEEAVHARK